MNTLVIDASIAVKWVVAEADSGRAEALLDHSLVAPDLLLAECANILWKKVHRDELSKEEALLAARLLQAAEIELLPTRSLLEAATRIAIELNHPAYDCLYLALAVESSCRFITADERFLRKVGEGRRNRFRDRIIPLAEGAGGPDEPTPKERRSRSSESGE